MAKTYKHPSASPNQPKATTAKAQHKVVASGAPSSGVPKLGFKGHKTQPAKSSTPSSLKKFK